MKELFREKIVNKKEYVEVVKKYRPKLDELSKGIKKIVRDYRKTTISEEKYIERMRTLFPEIEQLDDDITNIGLPPHECAKADNFLQGSVIFLHNILLQFSEEGLIKWNEKRRNFLVVDNLKNYVEEIKKFDYEFRQVL